MYVPSFPRQGTIYSVIVRQTGVNSNTQESAYVSSTSYSCPFDVNGPGQYCYDSGLYEFFSKNCCWHRYIDFFTCDCVFVNYDHVILHFIKPEKTDFLLSVGDMQTQIVCSILGAFGLFLCFFGHRFFKFGEFS